MFTALEVIGGKTLEQVLIERVFRPLGMKDTIWAVPKEKQKRLAALYGSKRTWRLTRKTNLGGTKRISNGKGLNEIDPGGKKSAYCTGKASKVFSGGGFLGYQTGGLLSTVADQAKFTLMLSNYGVMENGKRLLKKATVQSMEGNQILRKYNSEDDMGVCFVGNVGAFRDGAKEFGNGGAAYTYWNIDRKDDTATVWFAQHIDMPAFEKFKGVDKDKADLWEVLHQAVRKGVKKTKTKAGAKKASQVKRTTPSKKVRRSISK